MFKGRLFHNFGATTEKALSPFVLQRERGTDKSNWSLGLKDLEAVYGLMKSQI